MESFKEYTTLRNIANYCAITGEDPQTVINEFNDFLNNFYTEQQLTPSPTATKKPFYFPNQLNNYQAKNERGNIIMGELRTGFQQAISKVIERMRAGWGNNNFFNTIQNMALKAMDNFLQNELMPKIKVKLGDNQKVRLNDPAANQQAKSWQSVKAGSALSRRAANSIQPRGVNSIAGQM